MKISFLLFLITLSLGVFAQNHHDDHAPGDGDHGNLINEMEIGFETGDGIVELAHLQTLRNTNSSIFLLPGSVYLAGHTGHFNTMGYDRFTTFLLNVMNHHASSMKGVQLESGVKLFGFEQQPFGANPGSSLKFLRVNFTELNVTSVVNLDEHGNKKLHFVLVGKLGLSQQNESMTALTDEDHALMQDLLQCPNCAVDNTSASWGLHNSIGGAIEFEYKNLLVKTYAELNRDLSTAMINGSNSNLSYNMLEKKLGIEIEYSLINSTKYGRLNAFTSLEYYNLNQNYRYDGLSTVDPIDKINKNGLLFKVGLKYFIGNFKKKKRRHSAFDH